MTITPVLPGFLSICSAYCAIEPLILAGARETIGRNPDITIVMEWSPGQITAAGFDVARFVADIAALGLRCFVIDGAMERSIEAGALAAMPYQAGVVLRRRDRGVM